MNCQEVDLLIIDMARGAEATEAELAHITGCRRCAERFAEEENTTAGLRALAAVSAGEQASPRVEDKLREAFRLRVEPAAASAPHKRRWAPAAVLVGAIAASSMWWLRLPPQHTAPPVAQGVAVETAAVVTPPVAVAPDQPLDQPRPRHSRRVVRPVREPAPAPVSTPVSKDAQIDFLAVAQGDGWTLRDGGRLVRVGLPRSALRQFGLPMNEARAQEQVQADVMLSNDGLLRAIRFVP